MLCFQCCNINIVAIHPLLPHRIDPVWMQHLDVGTLLDHVAVFGRTYVTDKQMSYVRSEVQFTDGTHLDGNICQSGLGLSWSAIMLPNTLAPLDMHTRTSCVTAVQHRTVPRSGSDAADSQ